MVFVVVVVKVMRITLSYCIDCVRCAVLSGAFIEPEHCVISHRHGDVLLRPLDGALCSVDNVRVHEPTRLTQGTPNN